MTSGNRMTWGFITDVIDVLERHGYRQHDTQHTGQAVGVIGDLARVYEGTRDAPYRTYLDQAPTASPPEPGSPGPEAGKDAVALSASEARTIVAALDEASLYKRDRAAACTGCAGQSCGTCQWRLQAAATYDSLAAQLHQTARAAQPGEPEPGSPGAPPSQALPAAGREAGQ
jgi:ferredoxin